MHLKVHLSGKILVIHLRVVKKSLDNPLYYVIGNFFNTLVHKWWVSKCDLRVCMIFTIVVNDVLCMQALLLSCIRSILNYMCTNFDNIVAVKWVYECVEREKRDGFSAVISSSFLCPPLLEVTSLCFWCYVVSLLSTRGIDSSY